MKKTIALFTLSAAVALLSCGGSDESNKTDTLSSTTTASESTAVTTTTDTSSAFMDLMTNDKIDIEKDPQTGYYRNKATQKQVYFYYNPATNDTFDYRGRVVNMALIKAEDGTYKVDESRIKVQSDDDLKVKSADGETKMKLETDGDAKFKNDSVKIKVRDGKVTIKKKG